jgi:oxygen-independent coproporphyrinogen-3 oxidase
MFKNIERDSPIVINSYPPILLRRVTNSDFIWQEEENKEADRRIVSLYFHIPFCPQKCDFCHFLSFSAPNSLVKKYIDHLKKEIELLAKIPCLKSQLFYTLYFGGGTPTYLKTGYFRELIEHIFHYFSFIEGFEFCVEIRPGKEATREKLALLKEYGVNRISIGAQSFVQEILDLNGRRHTVETFEIIYHRLREIGFDNINIDILCGMPYENEETWGKTIKKLLQLSPENISLYNLHIYRKSGLFEGILKSPGKQKNLLSESSCKKFFSIFYHQVFEAGYLPSTTYTFTKSPEFDHVNRRLRNKGCDHIGLGLSANSYFNRTLYENTKEIDKYFHYLADDRLPIHCASKKLTKDQAMKRAIIFGLRTAIINRQDFQSQFGQDPLLAYQDIFEKLDKQGIVEIYGNDIKLNRAYFASAYDVARMHFWSDEKGMKK